jgi:hypothetical protein
MLHFHMSISQATQNDDPINVYNIGYVEHAGHCSLSEVCLMYMKLS